MRLAAVLIPSSQRFDTGENDQNDDAGFCIVGGQIASNALAATYYPTTMRSSGVGWALGIGRIGSIVGPLIGGIMLARHVGAETLFMAAAVPGLCASLAAFALARITRRDAAAAALSARTTPIA
jgi:AAHS family 4-hydroxybenzoate transporter-like MFS transporter